MKIHAIIPVRSGSRRVMDKNVRPFAQGNLLKIKIQQLLTVPEICSVCVNSNDEEMLELAGDLGAIAYQRDPYYASDSIPMSEVYRNMVEPLECDVVCYATVTTPFIDAVDFSRLIKEYIDCRGEHDSVHTSSRVFDFLRQDGKALNYNPECFPRSQDLPNIQKLVFGAAVIERSLMICRKSSLGAKPKLHEVSQLKAMDIDSPLDFEIAEHLYQVKVLESKAEYHATEES